MQPGGGAHMGLDQRLERRQQGGHGAHLVGQRGQAQLHPLAGVAFGLAVQGLMLAVFLEHDHCQQAGTGPAARDRVERGGRLADLLAVPAGELLTDGLDDLPLPRDHLQRLGDVLAHLQFGPHLSPAHRGQADANLFFRHRSEPLLSPQDRLTFMPSIE
jgi:hypothetical protein